MSRLGFVREIIMNFPYFVRGTVVKGFGRGSKQLGFPTANFSEEVVAGLPQELIPGVYYGWASVDNGGVSKMVASIGWNPFYNNEKKSMETHIMHTYPADFYGSELKVCVLGFLRPEANFPSLDDLIAAIKNDIKDAKTILAEPDYVTYQRDEFFLTD